MNKEQLKTAKQTIKELEKEHNFLYASEVIDAINEALKLQEAQK